MSEKIETTKELLNAITDSVKSLTITGTPPMTKREMETLEMTKEGVLKILEANMNFLEYEDKKTIYLLLSSKNLSETFCMLVKKYSKEHMAI